MHDIFMGLCRRTGKTGSRILYMSDGLLRLLGYTNGEKYRGSYIDLISPPDRAEVERELGMRRESGSRYLLEYGLFTRDGRRIQVRESGELVREDGEDYYYSELIDLTAYYALAGYYRDMLNAVQMPIFITDNNKNLIFLNQATEKLAGVTLQNSVGKPCSILKMSGCGSALCGIARLEAGDDCAQPVTWRGRTYQVYTSRIERSPFHVGGYITVAAELSKEKNRRACE